MAELTDDERLSRNRVIRGLLDELESEAPGEKARASRVSVYAVAAAGGIVQDEDTLLSIRYAAELHGLSEDALQSEAHPFLVPSLAMIRHQDESWNSTGTPDGLAGWKIPFGARIIAVAKAFDTMTFPLGGPGTTPEAEAIRELHRQGGKLFDPEIVKAFLGVQPIIQPVGL